MKAWRCKPIFALGLTVVLAAGCHAKPTALTTTQSRPNTSAPYLGASGANVLPVQVGGPGLCGQHGYENEPCTEVQICVPGTRQCEKVSDVLVDTGSIGLRIFSSVVSLPLPAQKTPQGSRVAECAQFGTGGTWGRLVTADVLLGGEPAVNAPIQLIDAGFGQLPKGCKNAESDPQLAGYNGILGVGLFKQDCGEGCVTSVTNGAYYACDDTGSCTGTAVAKNAQLLNVVALLPQDGNGFLLALPQIDGSGAAQVSGALILGLDTQANNRLAGVTAYGVDRHGNFTTSYLGHAYPNSYLDSGSNALFFPNTNGLPVCAKSADAGAPFYCPAEPTSALATNVSGGGGLQTQVDFQVGNAESLMGSQRQAFNNLSGVITDSFVWGLPFFYGRAVAYGIENRTSSLSTGPYLAY